MAHNETVHIAHAGFPGGMVINAHEFNATTMELFHKEETPVATQGTTSDEDMRVAGEGDQPLLSKPKGTQRTPTVKAAKPVAVEAVEGA